MNIEKDWVVGKYIYTLITISLTKTSPPHILVVISNKDSKNLSIINSYFYQIDLLCNSLIPAIVGEIYLTLLYFKHLYK